MRNNTNFSRAKYLQMAGALLCIAATAAKVWAQDDLLTPQDFARPGTVMSSDSYDLLVMAGKSIQYGGEGTPGTSEKLTPAEDLKRQRAFTQKNARSLQLMQEAMREPIIAPPARDLDFTSDSGNYAALRSLARLVMQRNRVFAADKAWKQAVEGSLDIIQMGDSVQNNAAAIGMLTGIAIQQMGRSDLWKWLDQLGAPEALVAAQRLTTIEADTLGFDAFQKEEKWVYILSLQRTLGEGQMWDKFIHDDKMAAQTFKPEELEQLRRFSARDLLDMFNRNYDALIARAKEPYRRDAPPVVVPNPLKKLEGLTVSLDYEKIMHRTHFNYTRNVTGNRLLIVALALQAFARDNAQYPQTLDELVPKYLQTIPRDPFASTDALSYKRDGANYRLYSVGPDATDNGGEPIPAIKPDDKLTDEQRDPKNGVGDLVAGESKL